MTKAFLAVNGSQGAASARIRELVAGLTEAVVGALLRRQPQGGTFHIEDIQDQVELALMRSGEHDVARSYVLYREERSKARAAGEGRRGKAERRHPRRRERRSASRSTATRCSAWSTAACEGLADATPAADPRSDAARPVRRRADGRGAQVGGAGGARADREGPGLQLRHRAPAAQHHPPRGAGRGGEPGRDGDALRRVLPAVHRARHRRRAAGPGAGPFRPGQAGQGPQGAARPAVRLPRPADAVRPLLPARAATGASSCRRRSSCAWRWAWRCRKRTAKQGRSSSTTCCRASTS